MGWKHGLSGLPKAAENWGFVASAVSPPRRALSVAAQRFNNDGRQLRVPAGQVASLCRRRWRRPPRWPCAAASSARLTPGSAAMRAAEPQAGERGGGV